MTTDARQDEIRILQETEIELVEGGTTVQDAVKALFKTADEIVQLCGGIILHR